MASKALQLPLFVPSSAWQPTQVSELPSWANAKRIAIDCETRDEQLKQLGPGTRRGAYPVGWSFAIEDGPSYYLPYRHEGGDNLPESEVLNYLRFQAKNFTGEIVGANLSYDLDYACNEGIEFPRISFFRDIQIADPLIYELHNSYSLVNIGKRFGIEAKDEIALIEAAKSFGVDPKGGMWRLPARYVGEYAQRDVVSPLEIYAKQRELLDRDELWGVFNLESKVLPVLNRMRRRGIRIDEDKLTQIEQWALKKETEALEQVFRETGYRIKVGDVWKSQVLAKAFEIIGVKLKKTAKGAPQIDADLLDNLKHPVAENIRLARKVNKMREAFAQSIRTYMINGRIHCTFNQIAREDEKGEQKGARFGRLSATDPNLQQQYNPEKEPELSSEWRKIFIPEEGAIYGSNDYCFSSDTEVLTKDRGFVLFKDIIHREELAQMDPNTRIISYAIPIAYQKKKYFGEMVSIEGKWATNLLLTPNHRCLLYDHKGNIIWNRADNYRSKLALWQPTSGILVGSYEPTDKDIITSIAIQADGSLRNNSYRIFCSKQRKINRLLENVKISNYYNKMKDPKFDMKAFIIPIEEAILLEKGKEKLFNRELLLSMTLERRQFFCKELMLWDGSKSKSHEYGGYTTTEKRNAEIVQEIATLSNLRATLRSYQHKNRKPCYMVTISPVSEIGIGKCIIENKKYDDYVYCVTMPLSTVVVRRNGKVSISGQSQQEPRWTTHFAAVIGLNKADDAAARYRNDPTTDNHKLMTEFIHDEEIVAAMSKAEFKTARGYAKNIFLGLCYGEGGAKLCNDLGLPTRWCLSINRNKEYFATKHEAYHARASRGSGYIYEAAGEKGQSIIDNFDRNVPYVRQIAQRVSQKANQVGYIKDIIGRRLHFPLKDDGTYDWAHKALNRLIQGTSATQMKMALVAIDAEGYFLQLQVHDEANGSYGSVEEALKVGKIMKECVYSILEPLVPFHVDTECGKSWGELELVK